MDDTSTIHGAVGVVIRHIDALAGLVHTYKEHRVESFRDVDYLVQKAEWAVDRHVYPIISALDAMDQFLVEWYRAVLMEEAESRHEENLKTEISNMSDDEVKNKLSVDLKRSGQKLNGFLIKNGLAAYVKETVGDAVALSLFKKIEEWKEAFGSDESEPAFDERADEVKRLMGMDPYDNDEDVDKNLRVARHMVRLFETKIPLIERFVARIKKGGVLVTGSLVEMENKHIKVQETPGGEPELMIMGMSLRELAENGKYYIRLLEVKKELHDVKCRTKPSDKPSEFIKIINRELSELQGQIDRHNSVLSERITEAKSVEDIGKVSSCISLELGKLNEMIKLISAYTESVIAPTIIHVYGGDRDVKYASEIANELKRKVEGVREHKERVFKMIIKEEIDALDKHIEELAELLTSLVSTTVSNVSEVDEIDVTMSSRIKETYEVIKGIKKSIRCVVVGRDPSSTDKQIGVFYKMIDALKEQTETVYKFTNQFIEHLSHTIKTQTAHAGRGSIATSFGRYVHRAAKHTLRVAPRAWSA